MKLICIQYKIFIFNEKYLRFRKRYLYSLNAFVLNKEDLYSKIFCSIKKNTRENYFK